MSEKKAKVVTLRTKRDRKDIGKEPEMVELKRMIRDGELDPDRTVDHLKSEDAQEDDP
jgi:hypothetical protein